MHGCSSLEYLSNFSHLLIYTSENPAANYDTAKGPSKTLDRYAFGPRAQQCRLFRG